MLWWYWWVIGFILIMAELTVPTFFIIWFGLAALVVGVILAIAPNLGFEVQIFAWAILSVCFVGLWFRVFRSRTLTRSGTSNEAIGEVGILIRDVAPYTPGKVRFQRPILGSDLWDCVAEIAIKANTRVCVVAIEGKMLKIKPA